MSSSRRGRSEIVTVRVLGQVPAAFSAAPSAAISAVRCCCQYFAVVTIGSPLKGDARVGYALWTLDTARARLWRLEPPARSVDQLHAAARYSSAHAAELPADSAPPDFAGLQRHPQRFAAGVRCLWRTVEQVGREHLAVAGLRLGI
jgi:hypothetical protein